MARALTETEKQEAKRIAAKIYALMGPDGEDPSPKAIAAALEGEDPKSCCGFLPSQKRSDWGAGSREGWNLADPNGALGGAARRAVLEWGGNPWMKSDAMHYGYQGRNSEWSLAGEMYPAGKSGGVVSALAKAAWRWARHEGGAAGLLEAEERMLERHFQGMTPGEGFFGSADKNALAACRTFLESWAEREAALGGNAPALSKAKSIKKKVEEIAAAKAESASRVKGKDAKPSEAAMLRARTLAVLCEEAGSDPEAIERLLEASEEVLKDPRALSLRLAQSSRPGPLGAALDRGLLGPAAAMLEAGADPWLAAGQSHQGNPILWGARAAARGSESDRECFEAAWADACLRGAAGAWRENAKDKCAESGLAALAEIRRGKGSGFADEEAAAARMMARLEAARMEDVVAALEAAPGKRPGRRGL